MAIPVKTQVMQAIETLLNTVEGIGTVKREETYPVDLENFPDPVLFFWADEDSQEPGNRLVYRTLDLWLAWFGRLADGAGPAFQAFQDQAEVLQARLHAALSGPNNLRAAGVVLVEEGLFRTAKANETWGEAIYNWRVQFAHLTGNAFEINP